MFVEVFDLHLFCIRYILFHLASSKRIHPFKSCILEVLGRFGGHRIFSGTRQLIPKDLQTSQEAEVHGHFRGAGSASDDVASSFLNRV